MKLACIGGPFDNYTCNYVVSEVKSKTIGEFIKELVAYCKSASIHTCSLYMTMSKTAFPDRRICDIDSDGLLSVRTTAYDDLQVGKVTANGGYGNFGFYVQPTESDSQNLLQKTYHIRQTYQKHNTMTKITELAQTSEMMSSADYKERFKAEYAQVNIRLTKLKNMCNKWDDGKLEFTPTCPRETYRLQINAMQNYRDILVIRAKIEDIDLSEL